MSANPPTANADTGNGSTPLHCPLILLPGLGGDARMFGAQRAAFPELILPDWIEPERNEPLAHYAARFAEVIDPKCHCFIGGVSFGGVMALEVASHLSTRECYLLGSIRDPRQLPVRLQVFRPISDLSTLLKWLSPIGLTYGGRWLSPSIRGMLHQLKEADQRFVRWAAGAILRWKPSAGVANVRAVQIHGDRDWIFPVSHIGAEKIIHGGGHLMSITHADEVNAFLRERMLAAPE